MYVVLEEAVELRAGRLQHDQVLEPRHQRLRAALAVDGQHRRTGLLALADPAVVVLDAADADPLPGVLLDLDPAALDRLGVVDEVPAEREGVVLDLADALLLGVGVARSASGCRSGSTSCLVAGEVGVGEVAAQRGRDVDVADLVPVGVAIDPHDAVLGLTVLIWS